MPDVSAFSKFWNAGYKGLVPISPPGATPSPTSALARRPKTIGKAPAIRGDDGLWRGLDLTATVADEATLPRWAAMGAGVGIRTGAVPGQDVQLVAVDIDTRNTDRVKQVVALAQQHLGEAPVRVGNAPKLLLVYAAAETLAYRRVLFDDGSSEDPRVELLSDGRQFVAHGIHPSTGRPYAWPSGVWDTQRLTRVTEAKVASFFAALAAALPAAREHVSTASLDRATVDQGALRGDPEAVRRAVAALPNTSDLFPAYDDYVRVGYAIKAACQDDPALGLDLFQGWAARWGGGNDPEVVEADWRRMKPPFSIGASWLYEQAERHGGGAFRQAEAWFQPVEDEPATPERDPFAYQDAGPAEEPFLIDLQPFRLPDDLAALPRREWVYAGHYIRRFVSTTLAPSGVGKSSLALVEAVAMASGRPLLGVSPVGGPKRVWVHNGEDPLDELRRRLAAIMLHYGVSQEDIGDRLFVTSGRDTEIILATETRDGVKISEPVETEITLKLFKGSIDVLILDPFVSSHRVTENDNGAIDFVTKRWARIADRAGCSIELIHHVRKLNGAEITVEDGRGAVALLATSRSARALARMTKVEALKLGIGEMRRRLFRFADGKNNLAPPADADTRWLELASVDLPNGDAVGVVDVFSGPVVADADDDEKRAAALAAIAQGDWRRDVRAGDAWAGAAIGRVYGMDPDDPTDRGALRTMVAEWIKRGWLREDVRTDKHRRTRAFVIPGLAPIADAQTETAVPEGTAVEEDDGIFG